MPTNKEFLAKKVELDDKQDKLTAGDNITINQNTNEISASYPDVVGATSSTAGTHGLVPAPAAGDEDKFLKGDGTWGVVSAGSASLAGLTDVDLNNPADGQALVYDAANQEWVNGEAGNTDYVELTQQEYNALTPEEQMNGTLYFITDGEGGGGSGSGGDTNVYGAFIDTNRIIKNTTTVSSTTTYTATEDCIVAVTYSATSSSASSVGINGVTIFNSGGSNLTSSGMLYLKRGDTMTFTPAGAYNNYTVYGLTFGTQNIFTPQIYSTEERCVGVWIDNKPLYCKTISTGSIASTHTTAHNISNVDKIVRAIGIAISTTSNYFIPIPYGEGTTGGLMYCDNTNITLVSNSDFAGYNESYITLYYTKTTDTAGSGSYNTLGVPMVHYSTDEHIVGTDVDGATIYEQTFTPDTLPALSDTGQNRHINTGLTGISEIWVESNSLCSGNMPFPYVHYDTSNIVGYWWDINSGNPILEVRAGASSASITITKLTVRYKKSIV